MKAVILAGGLGTRLRPFTEIIPKPLLPLGERSLMEVQILMLQQHGFEDIIVATNYRSELVEAFLGDGSRLGVKLTFSREERPLGTCGPLSLLRDQLTEPFLLINGDILTKLDFRLMLQFAVQQDCTLTVGTKVVTMPFRFGNVLVNEHNHIIGVEEKPDLQFEILAGVYCLKPDVFEYIPKNEYFGIDQLIKTMLARSACISRYLIHEYWLDIGQVDDYDTARRQYSSHFLQPASDAESASQPSEAT
ncbi:MAG TPA: sugar phosphate nucleotidyltransferase [Verrucomicrobiota bacterium]|nr:sugar phosphate nucleotidyltransferase [Verrucomicrobiota bacterium]